MTGNINGNYKLVYALTYIYVYIYIYSLLVEFPTAKRVFKINSKTQAVIKNMFSLIKCFFV